MKDYKKSKTIVNLPAVTGVKSKKVIKCEDIPTYLFSGCDMSTENMRTALKDCSIVSIPANLFKNIESFDFTKVPNAWKGL